MPTKPNPKYPCQFCGQLQDDPHHECKYVRRAKLRATNTAPPKPRLLRARWVILLVIAVAAFILFIQWALR